MKKSAAVKILTFIAAIAAITTACGTIYRSGVAIPPQPVSGPVTIGNEWIEIVPPSPLKPLGSQHWVTLMFGNYTTANSLSPTSREDSTINLKDGGSAKIEAFLLDDKGQSHDIYPGGSGRGIDLYPRPSVNEKGIYETAGFPKDRNYIKLRIRSSIPIKLDRIEWVSNVPR